MHHCKPDTSAWIFLSSMEALKYFKNLVVETHIKSNTIITHRKNAVSIRSVRTNFYGRLRCIFGKLDGVIHQIAQCYCEAIRIGIYMKVADFDSKQYILGANIAPAQ